MLEGFHPLSIDNLELNVFVEFFAFKLNALCVLVMMSANEDPVIDEILLKFKIETLYKNIECPAVLVVVYSLQLSVRGVRRMTAEELFSGQIQINAVL